MGSLYELWFEIPPFAMACFSLSQRERAGVREKRDPPVMVLKPRPGSSVHFPVEVATEKRETFISMAIIVRRTRVKWRNEHLRKSKVIFHPASFAAQLL